MNKMKIFRNIVFLVIHFLPLTHVVGQPNEGLSSVLVEEGKLAAISCVTNAGSQSEYFWRKGESLHNSTDIAFFISGLPTDDSGRFKVTNNGTLIVKKVTLADEGKYICRVSSEESDCHGEVFVFVKALLQDFQLTIENCEPENSCVISTESNKQTSLTCKATNASPSMRLKWFNGSHEIKDNIQENSLTKGPSREISSTIRNVYKSPFPLTCQAVDFKTSNDDGMFAHVQFRTPASTADTSPGWTVTAILFIVGFVILFLIFTFITVWPKIRKGKDVETQNSAERESLLSKDNELKEKREQISKLEKALVETNVDKQVKESKLASKDTELKEKREQILKLETDLRTKGDEIKTLSEEMNNLKDSLMETNADKRVNESNVTSKNKELQDKRQQILKLEKSLETVKGDLLKKNMEQQTQKDNLTQKELEIQKLQSKLEHINDPLTKIQKREQEISSKEKRLIEREADVKKHEQEISSKEKRLIEREADVKKREQHLNSKESKLGEQETDIKKREWEVNQNKMKLTAREAETKKQLLHLERKERRFRLDQMDVKDPIRINCKLITSGLGDDARVGTKDIGGQAKVTTKKYFWKLNAKDARFHTIYPSSAKPQDICQSIVDLVEHALDGGNSCLIAYDNSRHEHWTTMFGTDKGSSDAIVPYATKTIFRKIKELAAINYQVDVKARFMDNSCMAKATTRNPTFFENFKKFDIANEQTALDLFDIGHGKFQQMDKATGHLVQFYIKAESDKETLTGTLILATVGSIQIIKECFLLVEPITQLTQNISAIISDSRCRSVLITHIHEDRVDETKNCLAMVEKISKKNKI